MGKARRVDVLERDVEREEHEKAHEEGFELDITDRREMEGLEDALGRVGGVSSGLTGGTTGKTGGDLLLDLEGRLKVLEQKISSIAK